MVSITSTAPNDFVCPLSKDVMRDPVVTTQGISFERDAIVSWLQETGSKICPVTGAPLKASSLRTNTQLQWKIKYWQYKKSDVVDEEEPCLEIQNMVKDNVMVDDEESLSSSVCVLERYVCPLTNQVMREPVMTREGHNYERSALELFVKKHGEICPFSGKPLGEPNFYDNNELAREINLWQNKMDHPQDDSQVVPEEAVVASAETKSQEAQVPQPAAIPSSPKKANQIVLQASHSAAKVQAQARHVLMGDIVHAADFLLDDGLDDHHQNVESILNEVMSLNITA